MALEKMMLNLFRSCGAALWFNGYGLPVPKSGDAALVPRLPFTKPKFKGISNESNEPK